MSPAPQTRALLSLILAMALTGSNVPLAKAIIAELPLYAFLFFRFALSSLALALLATFESGPRISTMTRRHLRDLTAMSAIGMVGFTVLLFEALRRTSASDTSIIASTLPAVAALIGAAVFHERLRLSQWGAVGLAVLGLMIVQASARETGQSSLVGNTLAAGAVLCEAGFVVIGKRLAPPYRPIRLALGANVVGLLLTLPLMLWEGRLLELATLEPRQWLACIWYVLSASVFALWLWYRGLPAVPTWLAGLATAALPISALGMSVALLGEALGPAKLVGAVLVVASIATGALAARR